MGCDRLSAPVPKSCVEFLPPGKPRRGRFRKARRAGGVRQTFDVVRIFFTQPFRQGDDNNLRMRLFRPTAIALAAVFALVLFPRPSDAGIADLAARVVAWWQARSADVAPAEPAEEAAPEATDEGGAASPGRTPGMCIAPREPPQIVCEPGMGFLCVDTPPGGVAGDSFVLHGTVDRKGSVLASIQVSVQHEYTKRTVAVPTADPAGESCRGDLAKDANFCLDAEGYFSARVPLPEKGPVTVSVSASRLSGASEEKRVRTSRVVAVAFDNSKLALDPDVRTAPSADGTHVTATLDLLGSCQFCDFIGASTGGVRVTVENVMTDARGAVQRISCPSTVEQGGQGRFVVGVPVGPGTNTLTITACNAATPEGSCPKVAGIAFTAAGSSGALEILSPPPAPAYDAAAYPTIAWEFTLGGAAGCVQMQFNREAPRELCPADDGRYRAELRPRVGVNVATLVREGVEEFAWTFGWGAIASPHANAGVIGVPDALRVALPARTVTEILLPLVNNFLASDERDRLIETMLGGGAAADEAEEDGAEPEAPAAAIAVPKCAAGGGGGMGGIALRGTPSIDGAVIEKLAFGKGRIDLRAVLHGLSVGIDLAPDADGDGKPDRDPLPLVIAFRKAIAEVTLEQRGTGDDLMLLLSAPNDDCSFKRSSYCTGSPAAFVPKNFVGGANAWGGFVRCDEKAARGNAVEACRALNALNAQTGVVAETVLDAVNNAVYCGGSAALTRLVREGAALDDLAFGCAGEASCEGTLANLLPRVELPLAFILRGGLSIGEQGLTAAADLAVGNAALYERTPEAARIPQAGLVVGDIVGAKPFASAVAHGGDLAAAVSLDALDALLFAATVQGDGRAERGLLDFDIDEGFFADLELDFVEQCDRFTPVPGEKESPPTLCYVRPRVLELLGPGLTTYGYFPAKQPLMLAVRGNRALAPRLAVRTLDELPVVAQAEGEGADEASVPTGDLLELELGGVGLTFYALEVDSSVPVDEFGNFTVKRDAEGHPVIHSMRPENPDPLAGPIVAFDLTLLLAVELGHPAADPADATKRVMAVRLLSDRSRLIVTPIAGSNATTVPSAGLIGSLAEKLKLALAGMEFNVPVPESVDLASRDPDSLMGLMGLQEIAFGPDGLALDVDPATNSVVLAVRAAITQLLHRDGEPVELQVP